MQSITTKYFSEAFNPLPDNLMSEFINWMQPTIAKNELAILRYPIENVVDRINQSLSKYNLDAESVIIFYVPAGQALGAHIDSTDHHKIQHASLVIPLLQHASLVIPLFEIYEYTVFWQDGEYVTTTDITEPYSTIKQFDAIGDDSQIRCEATTTDPILMRTDLPHGLVKNISPLLLCTIRFGGNPKFDEVAKKLNLI